MKIANKLLVFIIIALIILPGLISCGTDDVSSNIESKSIDQSKDESEIIENGPPEGSFNNETVTIYTIDTDRNKYGEMQFNYDEDIKANVINEAVLRRNNLIKEKHGIEIKIKTANSPTDDLQMYIDTGTVDFDIVCDSVDRMLLQAIQGYFITLDDVLDLEASWWDQRSIKGLSIEDGKTYVVAGDALITDKDNIYLTLFNKKMYNETPELLTKYGDIYELVKDRKFTIDRFTEMSRIVSKPDEDGNYSFNATFGNLSHSYGATIMMNGAGIALAEKDGEGGVHVRVADEDAQRIFDQVYSLMSNKSITQRAELIIQTSKYGFAELEEMFTEGRGLFYNTTVASVSILKNLEEDMSFSFGVLPIPKYSDDQEDYYCAVNRYHSGVFGIPLTATPADLEKISFVLNALGYYNNNMDSGTTVMEAYTEVTLKSQAADAQEDEEMLDLIFKSKMYDLGSIFTWGSLVGLYGSVIADDNQNTLTSKWEAMENEVKSQIEQTINQYKNIS